MLGTPDRAAVERMVAAMVTRGPDASGLHAEAQVVLGHQRLRRRDAVGYVDENGSPVADGYARCLAEGRQELA